MTDAVITIETVITQRIRKKFLKKLRVGWLNCPKTFWPKVSFWGFYDVIAYKEGRVFSMVTVSISLNFDSTKIRAQTEQNLGQESAQKSGDITSFEPKLRWYSNEKNAQAIT